MQTECRVNAEFLTWPTHTFLPPLRLKCVGLPQFEPGCPFASAALEDSNLEGQAKLSRGQKDCIRGWLLYPWITLDFAGSKLNLFSLNPA